VHRLHPTTGTFFTAGRYHVEISLKLFKTEYTYASLLKTNNSSFIFMRFLKYAWIGASNQLQESLSNAKGSARQPWYIVRNSLNRPPLWIAKQYQRNLYIVEKYFQCATIPSLTMQVYLHSFSRCSLSNIPTSVKFRENLNVQQFKVIQGRWFWYQSKAHMPFPISD